MPSIATGIDSLIKDYFEHCRKKEKLPPFLKGKVEGKLITDLKKTYYYDIENFKNYYLWGRLDEVIQLPDGLYIPLDHKTRANLPKGEPHDAYKFQLGVYSLLLKKENKGKEVDFGYLVYYYPEKKFTDYDADEIKHIINFNFEVKEVKLDINDIKKNVENAINCLELEKLPESGKDCEYCKWIENTKKIYYIGSTIGEIKKEKVEEGIIVKVEEIKEENIKDIPEKSVEMETTEIEEKKLISPQEIKKGKKKKELPESLF